MSSNNIFGDITSLSPVQQFFFVELGISISLINDKNRNKISTKDFVFENYFDDIETSRIYLEYVDPLSVCFDDFSVCHIPDLFLEKVEIRNLYRQILYKKDQLSILDNFFDQSERAQLIRVHDILNIGYFTDTIVIKAFKDKFNFKKIRKDLNLFFDIFNSFYESFFLNTIEVSFTSNEEIFLVSFEIPHSENVNKEFIIKNTFTNQASNFIYLESFENNNTSTVTLIWFKDAELENYFSFAHRIIPNEDQMNMFKLNSKLATIELNNFSAELPASYTRELKAKKEFHLSKKITQFIDKRISFGDIKISRENLNAELIKNEVDQYAAKSGKEDISDYVISLVHDYYKAKFGFNNTSVESKQALEININKLKEELELKLKK